VSARAALRVGTRGSALALWQAERIRERLTDAGYPTERIEIRTTGDLVQDVPLARIGSAALFTRQIDDAMLADRIDIAVHSLKDLPTELPPGIAIAAIGEREDPSDALVGRSPIRWSEVPLDATVATSSLRRKAQLLHARPDLRAQDIRGNVDTRLAKLDRGEYDAIILAVAGLVRLGLEARIRSRLEVDDSLPAPGQGALGIECLADRSEVLDLMKPLDHAPTARCVQAERAVSRALGGSCAIPLGAYAEEAGSRMRLRALVASLDGRRVARAQCEGPDPVQLAAQAVSELRRQGAAEILSTLAK
jgi:hydroxymethylbilane synthase